MNVLAAGVTALVLCAPPRGPGDAGIHARELADGLRSRQVCVTGSRRLTIVWVD